MAQAYASVPPFLRASLKTALALYFHLYRRQDAACVFRSASPSAGFSLTRASRPAPWLLALLSPEQRAPARLLAGLVPAVLAGVENILVICPGQAPSRRNCLALELAGIEQIFVLSDERFADPQALLQALSPAENAPSGPGRLLLFPTLRDAASDAWRLWKKNAAQAGIPVWEDSPAPLLRVENAPGLSSCPSAAAAMELLAWCHGDARIASGPATDASEPDASYPAAPGREDLFHPECPLSLGPGLEGVWAHRGLDPAFFRQTRLVVNAGACHE